MNDSSCLLKFHEDATNHHCMGKPGEFKVPLLSDTPNSESIALHLSNSCRAAAGQARPGQARRGS